MMWNLQGIGKPVLDKNKMYFVSNCYMGLLCVDLDTWNVKILCNIFWKTKACSADCYKLANKIYCISRNRVEIAIYDLQDHAMVFKEFSGGIGKIVNTCIRGNQIWIFSNSLEDSLIYYDTKTEEFKEVEEWKKWVQLQKLEGRILIIAQEDDEVAITLSNSNQIIKTKYPYIKYELLDIPVEDKLFCPFYREGALYVTSAMYPVFYDDNGNPFSLNIKTTESDFFMRGYPVAESLFLITVSKLYRVKEAGVQLLEIPELQNEAGGGSLFIYSIEYKEKVIFLPWNSPVAVIYHKRTEKYETCKIAISSDEWLKTYDIIYECDRAVSEDFISYVMSGSSIKKKTDKINEGKQIYQVLIEEGTL